MAALGGCSDPSDRPHRQASEDDVPCTPGGTFDLNGRFGVLATLNTTVEVLGLELEDPNPQAELLLLADIAQSDLSATVTARICDIKIPEIQLANQPKPIIFRPGPNLLASVPETPAAATISGHETCAAFANPEPLVVILGARLADPINDFLPTDAATAGCGGDPLTPCPQAEGVGCICDQESDAHPGATLVIENAPVIPDLDQVYVTLRTSVALDGEIHSSDLIRGEVTPTLEQTILDCHRAAGPCDSTASAAIRNINPSILQDERYPSTFVAKRIDPTWDCLRLNAERETLFPL